MKVTKRKTPTFGYALLNVFENLKNNPKSIVEDGKLKKINTITKTTVKTLAEENDMIILWILNNGEVLYEDHEMDSETLPKLKQVLIDNKLSGIFVCFNDPDIVDSLNELSQDFLHKCWFSFEEFPETFYHEFEESDPVSSMFNFVRFDY